MILQGNIVRTDKAGYGFLEIGKEHISSVNITGALRNDAQWILPGFIDVHLHGIYQGDATPELVHLMAEKAPQSGLTTLCPALAADVPETMKKFVERVRDIIKNPVPGNAKFAGSHLEGPFIELGHKGGMNENLIRNIDLHEIEELLDAADGTLKIMTLSPELENAMQATRLLSRNNVRVSAGHTGLKPEKVAGFVENGGKAVCHLFDTFDGRPAVNGVMSVSLADEVLVNDNLYIELISDGIHVPPTLLKLAIRAAGVDRILAITDSMCGTGLPDGAYPMLDAGRSFTLKNGDCCRLTDDPDIIVGSCLTMNRAFYNLVERDGFSVIDAMKMTSYNAARYLDIADKTGSLQPGLAADIAVLSADKQQVIQTFVDGVMAYER